MVTIIITHEVQDFNNWKQGFEAAAENRAQAGVTIKNVYRDADHANKVTVTSEMADAASAKAFLTNLKTMLENSGQVTNVNFMILDKVN